VKHYDICVLGAGSAGLVAATTANRLGAKTLLIEKNKIGGECLHSGCIPSKTLIHAARLMHDIQKAPAFGLPDVELSHGFDFANVMQHVQNTVGDIYSHENPSVFSAMGIDVIIGNSVFTSPDTLRVDNQIIRSRFFVLCTGSSPLAPDIPGLFGIPFFTNDSIWGLRKLPKELLIIGGGPIGIELGQCFARFGSVVHVIVRSDRILGKEEREISRALEEILRKESMRFLKNTRIESVTTENDMVVVSTEADGVVHPLTADALLVATGRTPNIHALGLEKAGVEYTPRGISVNDHLQTTAQNIYACGDCIGQHQFTHAASFHADVALDNILNNSRRSVTNAVMPWVTFTDPEIAHVGPTEEQARQKGIPVRILKVDCTLDRFITEGTTEGFIKIILGPDDAILGAHSIGAHSGEYIQHLTLAMQIGISARQIAETIYPYPTFSEIVRKAFVRHFRTKT